MSKKEIIDKERKAMWSKDIVLKNPNFTQDEIGTPYCITIDFESLEDNAVTIRERDSMKQERISIDQVESWLAPRLLGC